MIGRKLGRFVITAELGHGGMATVWRAHDELLNRPVALKILDAKLADSPKIRRRFVHESRAVAHLNHPGIVAVFDAGEAEGLAYIALSLVDGDTVSDLASRRLLPLPEAIRVIGEAADALAHAHAREVIHRDVTGRNIMVGRDGRVFVLDFGLARAAWESRVTTSETPMGTAAYLAPEIVRGAEADERSDLYGLGVVLYEALTGAFPFTGERPEAVLFQAMNGEPVWPRDRRPEIPEELERLVLKAIAREPGARFASADEFAASLRALPPRGATGEASRTGAGAGALSMPVTSAPGRASSAPDAHGTTAIPSPLYLVVLPLGVASAAADPDGACGPLAARLTEGLTAALASTAGVTVIHPPAALDPGARADPAGLAQDLGANALFQGVVDRAGTRVRVSYTVLDPWRRTDFAGGVLDGSALQPFDLGDRLVMNLTRTLGLAGKVGAGGKTSRPPDPAAADHYAQALTYLRRHDDEASVDGSIRLLEELIASEGDRAIYYAALTRACLCRYELTERREWETRAAAACERALELDADAPEVRLASGALRLASGQHDTAIAEFERVARELPESAEPGLGIARAHAEAGRYEQAETAALGVVAAHPDDWRGHSLLGWVYYCASRFQEAIAPWKRAVELAPDNAAGIRKLGSAFYRLDHLEEAAESYKRSLAMQPNDLAYGNLGTALYYMGAYEEAVAWMRKATEFSPLDPTCWGNLGDACRWIHGHEREGTMAHDRAIALMREKLERNPSMSFWWARLAGWLSNRGRLDEATVAIERALALTPGDARCMVEAGKLRYLLGDRPGCLKWLRLAIETGFPVGEFRRSRELIPLRADPEFLKLIGEDVPTQDARPGAGSGAVTQDDAAREKLARRKRA